MHDLRTNLFVRTGLAWDPMSPVKIEQWSYKHLRRTYSSRLEALSFKIRLPTKSQGNYYHYNEQLLKQMLIPTNSDCQEVVLNYRITRRQTLRCTIKTAYRNGVFKEINWKWKNKVSLRVDTLQPTIIPQII